MKYLLMKDGSVMREGDLALIPPSEENKDWLAYLADKSKTVEPFDYAAEEARQLTANKNKHRTNIDAQRDSALTAGCLHKGKLYPFDDVMIAAITGRIVRWREGRIPVDAKLPVRLKDNSIELLSRDEHLDLADALSAHGESIYAASWAAKDAL